MCENEGIRHIEIHRKVKPTHNDDDDEKSEIVEDAQPEQLLRGDSDQVSLGSLLKAVMDISDRLNHQEEKLKEHENSLSNSGGSTKKKTRQDRVFPVTAVRKYNTERSFSSDSDLDQSQTSSKLSSNISGATSRSTRSTRLSPSATGDGRKNISFSNESVREIDMENQRLLKEILHTKPKTLTQRRGKAVRPLSASAINRQREQKDIDRENLRLLNRLQSVKATKALSRDNLLSDHHKNMEHSTRISRGRSRPSSARTSCSMDSFDRSMDLFDNESIRSSSASVRSRRTVSSKGSRPSSAKSRPSSGKKKVTVCNVWEPGW